MYDSSEYGKGFAYNLGLFLAHAERNSKGPTWFYGAIDHLSEIETSSEVLGEEIANAVIELKAFCEAKSQEDSDSVTEKQSSKDVASAVRMAKNLLYMWDIRHGIPAVQAIWS